LRTLFGRTTARQQGQKRSRTRRAPHVEAFCRGSFSAVWTPRIARAGSLFSSFRDLHDLRIFALLESQALQNFGSFCKTSAKIAGFCKTFLNFRSNRLFFAEIFHRKLSESREIPDNCRRSTNFPDVSEGEINCEISPSLAANVIGSRDLGSILSLRGSGCRK